MGTTGEAQARQKEATKMIWSNATAKMLIWVAFGIGLCPAIVEARDPAPRSAQVEYSQIDVRLSQDAIAILKGGTPDQVGEAVAGIEANPAAFNPEVFFALSSSLFDAGKKDEGAFWFYAGQLRARFDANRCADVEARQVVSSLTYAYGGKINQYTFQDPDRLEQLLIRVVDWDRKTPHDYDQRWINRKWNDYLKELYQRGKKSAPEPLSLPAEQWEAIAEETRVTYLKSHLEGLAEYKAEHPRNP
jgi:hypothetical protein